MINLLNQKFGKWTVIAKKHTGRINAIRWECQCQCGQIGIKRASDLLQGRSTQCHYCALEKLHNSRVIDLTGQKFGKLTVLSEAPSKKSKISTRYSRVWNCRCDCGNFCEKRGNSLKTGTTTECKKCRYLINQPAHILSKLYSTAKRGANDRRISFDNDLTIESLWALFEKQGKKCALSGIQLEIFNKKGQHSKTTASLDRIDSTKGYTIENVQWIHKTINLMKNRLPQSEFIDFCQKIVKNLKLLID